MQTTYHAEKRAKQRSIPKMLLDLIEEHGRVSYAPGGAEKIFFGKKEIHDLRQNLKKIIQLFDKSNGTTLIIKDDSIITVYKKYN